METKFKPNYAIHPGKFLKEEMEAMGITQKRLSELTGISKTIINEVVHGKRKINGEFAVKIEAVLYSPAKYWLNLQALYEEALARISLQKEEEGQSSSFTAESKDLWSNANYGARQRNLYSGNKTDSIRSAA